MMQWMCRRAGGGAVRRPGERVEQRSVVRCKAALVGLDAHQNDVGIANRRVVAGRAQQARHHAVSHDRIEVGLDATDRRAAGVDRIDLPPRRRRTTLEHDNPRRFGDAFLDPRCSEQRGHGHADDAGSNDDDLANVPVRTGGEKSERHSPSG